MSESDCALCQWSIGATEETSVCPECGAVYHRACHLENQGCGNYGCSRVPPQAAQAEPIAPPSVWGQDTKHCPACNQEIRAAALRCRHCGTVFESASPMSADEFARARDRKGAIVRLERAAVATFVGGLVPCTAPIVLVASPLFLLRKRSAFRKLSRWHRVLVLCGVLVSLMWVMLAIAVLLSAGPGGAG